MSRKHIPEWGEGQTRERHRVVRGENKERPHGRPRSASPRLPAAGFLDAGDAAHAGEGGFLQLFAGVRIHRAVRFLVGELEALDAGRAHVRIGVARDVLADVLGMDHAAVARDDAELLLVGVGVPDSGGAARVLPVREAMVMGKHRQDGICVLMNQLPYVREPPVGFQDAERAQRVPPPRSAGLFPVDPGLPGARNQLEKSRIMPLTQTSETSTVFA